MKEPNNSVPEKNGADRLYAAIGQIDDRYVSEALAYRAEKKPRARILPRIRIAAAVAAALLVLTVSVGLFTDTLLSGGSPSVGEIPGDVLWAPAEAYPSNLSLLSCLQESRETAVASALPPTLDTGKVTLIWRDASDGTYYSVTVDFLSQTQKRRLDAFLTDASAAPIDPNTEAPPFSLWIAMGDGTAVSPYLGASDGNVSYGVPSDYAPEQLPSEAFAAFLEELIEKNLP